MKQEYYEQIFSYLGDAIVMADEDSRILFCNEAFSTLFEYVAEDIIGKPLSVLMSRDMSDAHFKRLKDYLNSNEPAKVMTNRATTMICYTRTGRAFPARISIARLASSTGKLGLAIVHDITNLELEKHQLQTLARTDSLTSLLNRTYLDEVLEKPEAAFSGVNGNLGILFIDLNSFKLLNDQHGHATGDNILRIIGQRIKNVVRDSDLTFRYGGDEFIVLARKIGSLENLQALARKIRETTARTLHVDGMRLSVSCAVGVSIYPRDAESLSDAIQLADKDMYRNK